jgi:predicted O-linked N-acetylglucosamine transferase (SPINDLY family)
MLQRLLRELVGRRSRRIPVDFFAQPDLPADAGASLARACDLALAGEAQAALRLLEADPRALAQALRAALLERLGREAEALEAYAKAAATDAHVPLEQTVAQHFYLRGRAYLNEKKPYAAIRCLELAHRLVPESPSPAEMLGVAGHRTGDTKHASRWYAVAIGNARGPERGALRLRALLDTLPQVYESAAQIESVRASFVAEVESLLADPPRVADPAELVNTPAFYLASQGRDDHALNRRLSELLLRACPALEWTAPHAAPNTSRRPGRPRIGFVSAYLYGHSVGTWYTQIVRLLLEGGRFDISLFTLGEVEPRLAAAAAQRGRHIQLPKELSAQREAIAAAQCDVLFFTDVHIHPRIFSLSFSRLAPLQALLVGHPASSGVPTMDCFISNVFQDSDGAQAHYSEELVRLPQILAYVEKTRVQQPARSRASLGLDRDVRYYVCPMRLQKMHPDFDAALAGILRRDARGHVLLFADPDKPLWQQQLAERFRHAMPDVAGRIVFRPHAPLQEFLAVLQSADAVLDPFHFSGGVTSYHAFSLGVPVVTLPGPLFRSRMTAGMYAQAGLEHLVPRDENAFVERALRFASDPAQRAEAGRRIVAAHGALFETRAAVDRLSEWLERRVPY